MAKILVAEDDRFLAEAYKTKLVKVGYEVVVVANGDEALREVQSFKPDIILLDLKMPTRDGFYFLEQLRAIGFTSAPIIVASNSGDKTDVEKAMALGAADYIVKSNLSMSGLIEKIEEHLAPKPQEPTIS